MLSDRVDLTADRDFGARITFDDLRSMRDTLAASSARSHFIQLSIDAGEEVPHLRTIKLYPWMIDEVYDETGFNDFYFSDDQFSNEMGFEVYGSLDNPFVLGTQSQRKAHLWVLSGEIGLCCDHCGKRLTELDHMYALAHDGYLYVCRHCNHDLIAHRDKQVPWNK